MSQETVTAIPQLPGSEFSLLWVPEEEESRQQSLLLLFLFSSGKAAKWMVSLSAHRGAIRACSNAWEGQQKLVSLATVREHMLTGLGK